MLNIESNIVIRVLLELAKEKIVSLPFHDCVMLAERHATVAKLIMEWKFQGATGAKPVTKITKCDLPRALKKAA